MAEAAKLQFRIRLTKGEAIAVGPGKVALLEAIRQTGSITAAAKQMGMSYRRAWLLVDSMNHAFKRPVVDAAVGGKRGGGTLVTPLGEEVIRRYRAIEATASRSARSDIAALVRQLRD